jgi:DNA-binding transcriptional MerR regulator
VYCLIAVRLKTEYHHDIENTMSVQLKTGKLFYPIGEVARMFDVNTSLIRFWEGEFDIIKPKKNKKGNRLFTQKDVDNFHVIFHLVKERGFTLDGAKRKLAQNKGETLANVEVVKSLKNIKSFLLEIKKEL